MRKLWTTGAVVPLSIVPAATVFTEPIMWAVQAVEATITNLDS